SKKEKLIILLIIGLVFPLFINRNISFSDNQEINKIDLKSSYEYIESFIHVFGNWSATTSEPWCSGEGSWSNPYIIENVAIDASNSPTDYGIYIQDSNVFFIIKNCKVYNSLDYGIYLESVNNSKLINNNCSNNDYPGIAILYECSNNTIQGNIVNDNRYDGIYFWQYCNNNTISGNIVNDNGETGISIYDNINNTIIKENIINNNGEYGIEVVDWSGFNTMSNNIVQNNGERGIDIEYQGKNNTLLSNIINNNGEFGVYLSSDCNYNTILKNTLKNNSEGIKIDGYCDYNVIKGNDISDHLEYGIYLLGGGEDSYSIFNEVLDNTLYKNNCGIYLDPDSNNNSLYKNFFLANEKHAIDDGSDNKWNSTTIGNYWDNWTSPDTNNNGIVDDHYPYIGGLAVSIDYLPIAEDGFPQITINSPSKGDAFNTSAPNFNVVITDDYLDEMWYTIDGGLHNYTFTENGIINQSAWDAIDDGNIKLTFFARDIPRNVNSTGVDIIKDTVAPIIIINSPTEGDEFGKSAPFFNVTFTDDNLDIMWYSFDGGASIYIIINNTVFNQTAWAALTQGEITITFSARDLAGNEASESVTVAKSVPSGLDPGVIITIIIVSIVGGVAVISVVYIFMKKRKST
ncbi:MAG: nitrous oxide reductase family maturation protein NosD, partial [Candidatus Odinarchaeota archaeon]